MHKIRPWMFQAKPFLFNKIIWICAILLSGKDFNICSVKF